MRSTLFWLISCSTITLTACQGVDDFLTDTGARQHSEQDMVVNPVPRPRIAEQKTYSEPKSSQQSSAIPTVPNTPAAVKQENQSVNTTNNKPKSTDSNMVPNVTPTFGE
ncbi:MAG: hypothetical protein A3F18_05800 [Legionellales bacterium RIFCSPHIGHO2_12_FULL_37_14]|nr:MAG: hypothetical protein A3F18_05800 [Legionellales bacterium RIFCSPHIGHO2_12_FULL_37_14]